MKVPRCIAISRFLCERLIRGSHREKSALACPFTICHKIYPSWRNWTIIPMDVLSE